MIILNQSGLSASEKTKVAHPYAKNSGNPVDLRRAGRAAAAFLADNPALIEEVGRTLDEPQR